MQSINLEELDHVTGGTTQATPSLPLSGGVGSTGSSGSGCNDGLLTSLNSISSSIKDLSSKNNNQGLFGGNGMLFLGMAMAMRRQSSEVVVYGGHHGGGGYYWRQSW